MHSQDIIVSTFEKIEKEICVKFFNTPLNYTATSKDKILYIANPDKRKSCPPVKYDYEKTIVDMPIGYKCLQDRDIARIIVDMLRASIEKPRTSKFLFSTRHVFSTLQTDDTPSSSLLAALDRNFINTHYHEECSDLVKKPVVTRRSAAGTLEMSPQNEEFYRDKVWPLGIVMYQFDDRSLDVMNCNSHLKRIETVSIISPRLHRINQTRMRDQYDLIIEYLKIFGWPMMSNRFDRDNYVTINWKNVMKTKEHYLERMPEDAWLLNSEGEGAPYDFDSITHAPVDYMCADCSLGQQTVQPLHDHLWQKTLTMGRRKVLSAGDIEALSLLYDKQCRARISGDDN
ncbi:hypothetical protein B5X24_HaOG208769 [Helicoverpa armigera]|uniref:Peptidase M12A domain-containing protein n=1 Tax=Helicoverpa armigera TaxID=29058 RepID=A0A2W1BJE9_HELAM|nr:hypothetical protein B5X24_HaOG208769 [Helicoverpa armigera]